MSDQIQPAPAQLRRPDVLETLIRGQYQVIAAYQRLAGEFLALDTRAMLLHSDGRLEHVGPDPVPLDVHHALAFETQHLATLLAELAAARSRACDCPSCRFRRDYGFEDR